MTTELTTLHTTTVDQHISNHEATGMRIMRLVEVRTDLADYMPGVDFEAMSDDDKQFVCNELAEIHNAMVELASLDADHRAEATEWLSEQGRIDFDGVASMVRKAIRETAEVA